jgi:hypothetical protein
MLVNFVLISDTGESVCRLFLNLSSISDFLTQSNGNDTQKEKKNQTFNGAENIKELH